MEVMVEGANPARNQIAGRSSQNKSVNFSWPQPIAPAPGSYVQVRITATLPNSLVGEAVVGSVEQAGRPAVEEVAAD